jgi:hypothetical protein
MVVHLYLEELDVGHAERGVRERESTSRGCGLRDGKGLAHTDGASEQRKMRARCEPQISGRAL